MATIFSLLLVSLAVALIVLVLVALPHLKSGAPVLSSEGEQRARRGAGRLVSGFRIAVTVLGEALGAGLEAMRDGPASARRRPVRQHDPDPLAAVAWTGPDELLEPTDDGVSPTSIGPRHAAR